MARRRRRRNTGDDINRSIELRLRISGSGAVFSSRIKDIRDDGTIQLLSPMAGARPHQVRPGTPINIVQSGLGADDKEASTAVVDQLHDQELEWIVIVEQLGEPEKWLIKRRGFAREAASFPIEVIIAGQEEAMEATCHELSGSGIRFNISLEKRDLLKTGMELELDFVLPEISNERGDVIEPGVELPPLNGRIVRMLPQETTGSDNQWLVGVQFLPVEENDEFDEDDQEIRSMIIRYVLKLQIVNQAKLIADA